MQMDYQEPRSPTIILESIVNWHSHIIKKYVKIFPELNDKLKWKRLLAKF